MLWKIRIHLVIMCNIKTNPNVSNDVLRPVVQHQAEQTENVKGTSKAVPLARVLMHAFTKIMQTCFIRH